MITLLLILLFGFAYWNDPSDQAMKGAIIGAFSAAYGFWIGSKNNETATENTGKAFDAIKEAAKAGTSGVAEDDAIRSGDTVTVEGTENAKL
jgi:hypothetical protein